MSEHKNGPPKKVEAPEGPNIETSGHHTTKSHQDSRPGQRSAFDAHTALQHRRAAAVRLPGGDPLYPGQRFHRASTGLRADGYRQGYAAAIRYVLREFGFEVDELTRAKLTAIAERISR